MTTPLSHAKYGYCQVGARGLFWVGSMTLDLARFLTQLAGWGACLVCAPYCLFLASSLGASPLNQAFSADLVQLLSPPHEAVSEDRGCRGLRHSEQGVSYMVVTLFRPLAFPGG